MNIDKLESVFAGFLSYAADVFQTQPEAVQAWEQSQAHQLYTSLFSSPQAAVVAVDEASQAATVADKIADNLHLPIAPLADRATQVIGAIDSYLDSVAPVANPNKPLSDIVS